MDAHRIVFQPIGGTNWRPEIQERIHVDLIEEHAEAAANDEAGAGRISESEARRQVVIIGMKDLPEVLSLHFQTLARNKFAEISRAVGVERSEVLPPQSVIDIELRGYLPIVLTEEIKPVHEHEALGIAHSDG